MRRTAASGCDPCAPHRVKGARDSTPTVVHAVLHHFEYSFTLSLSISKILKLRERAWPSEAPRCSKRRRPGRRPLLETTGHSQNLCLSRSVAGEGSTRSCSARTARSSSSAGVRLARAAPPYFHQEWIRSDHDPLPSGKTNLLQINLRI